MRWTRAAAWVVSVVGICGVVYVAVCVGLAWSRLGPFRVRDAVGTAAAEVRARLGESSESPQQALDAVLRLHHDASVSPIWFDETGAPVDAWGHRFRARTDGARPPRWVVCESAGPDGEFGTDDDIGSRWEE